MPRGDPPPAVGEVEVVPPRRQLDVGPDLPGLHRVGVAGGVPGDGPDDGRPEEGERAGLDDERAEEDLVAQPEVVPLVAPAHEGVRHQHGHHGDDDVAGEGEQDQRDGRPPVASRPDQHEVDDDEQQRERLGVGRLEDRRADERADADDRDDRLPAPDRPVDQAEEQQHRGGADDDGGDAAHDVEAAAGHPHQGADHHRVQREERPRVHVDLAEVVQRERVRISHIGDLLVPLAVPVRHGDPVARRLVGRVHDPQDPVGGGQGDLRALADQDDDDREDPAGCKHSEGEPDLEPSPPGRRRRGGRRRLLLVGVPVRFRGLLALTRQHTGQGAPRESLGFGRVRPRQGTPGMSPPSVGQPSGRGSSASVAG